MYKDKFQLEIEVESEGSSVSLGIDKGNYLYMNGKTKSVHFLSFEETYSSSTLGFNAGYVSGDNASLSMKTFSVNIDDAETSALTGDGAVYGSEEQGIGVLLEGSKIVDGTTTNQKTISTFYLDTTETSGEATLKSGNYGDASNSNRLTGSSSTYANGVYINDAIYINVDRDTGSIAAEFSDSAISLVGMTFSGSVSSQTSYYINDDMWGVVGTAGTYDGSSLKADTSFMVAIPDDITIESNTITSLDSYDDESSWGYWTATFDNDSSINTSSTWVAGTKTASSYVSGLMTNAITTNLTFSGHVIGSVETANNGLQNIKMDSTNAVNLTFQLGSNALGLSGDVKFSTTNSTFDFDVNSGTVLSSGFSSSDFTSNTTATATGSMNGKFYGTNDIKSVGGNLNITNTDGSVVDIASASFKATK